LIIVNHSDVCIVAVSGGVNDAGVKVCAIGSYFGFFRSSKSTLSIIKKGDVQKSGVSRCSISRCTIISSIVTGSSSVSCVSNGSGSVGRWGSSIGSVSGISSGSGSVSDVSNGSGSVSDVSSGSGSIGRIYDGSVCIVHKGIISVAASRIGVIIDDGDTSGVSVIASSVSRGGSVVTGRVATGGVITGGVDTGGVITGRVITGRIITSRVTGSVEDVPGIIRCSDAPVGISVAHVRVLEESTDWGISVGAGDGGLETIESSAVSSAGTFTDIDDFVITLLGHTLVVESS